MNDVILQTTLNRAHRTSGKDGRLRFVFATSTGYKISLRDITYQARYVTNGVQVWFYDRNIRLTPENGKEIKIVR